MNQMICIHLYPYVDMIEYYKNVLIPEIKKMKTKHLLL